MNPVNPNRKATPMNKLANAKKLVAANKTRILTAALVVTTTAVYVQAVTVSTHIDFLKSKNLMDEYLDEAW